MRGVTIIALKKTNYGKWAFNLAVSLKFHSPNIPIQLIHDGSATAGLDEKRLAIFDVLTPVDESYYTHNGRFSPGRAKILAYKHYAFTETIQLDADSICVQDITSLFDKCTGDIHMQCNKYWNQDTPDKNSDGTDRLHDWCTVAEARKFLKLSGNYEAYGVNSSFMFFRKGKKALAFVKQSLAYCDTEELNMTRSWGGSFPDELAWGLTIIKQGVTPTFEGQDKTTLTDKTSVPNFFPHDGSVKIFERKEFYFITYYGARHFTSSMFQSLYDRAMRQYLAPLGMDHLFKIHTLLKDKHVTGK